MFFLVANIARDGTTSASTIDAVDATYAAVTLGETGAEVYVVELDSVQLFRRAKEVITTRVDGKIVPLPPLDAAGIRLLG